MAEVILRNIEKGDVDALSSIISETWNFEGGFSKKLVLKMGRLFLAEALAKSSFNKVAVIGGKPAGIITARAEGKQTGCIKTEWFFIKCIIPVLLNHETVKALRIFSEMEKLNERLMKRSGRSFDSEIPLFVMGEEYRGMGAGGKLFTEAVNYLKENECKNYFVYTDTTCDYKFYEHKGARMLTKEDLLIPV